MISQTTVKEPLLDWLDRFLTVEKQVNLLDRPVFFWQRGILLAIAYLLMDSVERMDLMTSIAVG